MGGREGNHAGTATLRDGSHIQAGDKLKEEWHNSSVMLLQAFCWRYLGSFVSSKSHQLYPMKHVNPDGLVSSKKTLPQGFNVDKKLWK